MKRETGKSLERKTGRGPDAGQRSERKPGQSRGAAQAAGRKAEKKTGRKPGEKAAQGSVQVTKQSRKPGEKAAQGSVQVTKQSRKPGEKAAQGLVQMTKPKQDPGKRPEERQSPGPERRQKPARAAGQSPERSPRPSWREKLCPVASRCGGCQWIDRDYGEQLRAKETIFRRLMEPFCRTEPIIGMEQPLHYRNKVHAVFGEDRKHNIISGIYEEKSHKIVPVESCLIENEKADEIIGSVRKLMKSFRIRPYNEDTDYGLLRHVLVRVARGTGQIMVVLVLTSPVMPSRNNFVKALLALHPEITTIVVSVNDRSTSMVLGGKEQVIYGRGYIEDRLCGKIFRISPGSFYQVNPVQAEKLYEKAAEYAGLTGKETVVDAYCGTGTIGIIAAGRAGKVIGVELGGDAIKDAVINARRNQVSNIDFYHNDAGSLLLEMAEQRAAVDVVMLDPPRSGSSEEFLRAVAQIRPGRVVYVSCEPETLARDLKYLRKQGFRVEKSVAVDMFPFTECIESVTLLTCEKGSGGKRLQGGQRGKAGAVRG